MTLEDRREYQRKWKAAKYKADPEFRRVCRERTDKWRRDNLERSRELAKGYARKRDGLPAPSRPEPDACECCFRKPAGRFKNLVLDHCHATGKFRGWLCGQCNRGLGLLGDTSVCIERALIYLKTNS